ncbi:MAG TPA: hypothetical protein VLD19_04255, partial [Chitinophagaceae bacterium]|nr:hypothetical protein [Chitinophagaceae bacterium]
MLPAESHEFRRLNYTGSLLEKLVEPSDIKGDRAGNTWISGHGVCRINRATGKPDFYMDSFPHLRFSRREVTTMGFDKDILWAGIYNNGLAGYDMYKGTFRHFTAQDGLPDNLIRAVYPIGGKLWIATATGIASLDLATNKISRFGGDDGFAPWPVSSGNLWYDTSTHYMYGGFTGHIIRFNPDSLLYAESPPSFFIESIHFSNDTTYYNPGAVITIPYSKNDMTVTMGGVNYNDVRNQRLAWRIANSKDTSWQPVSGDAINFNNLPPGTFRLQIRLYAVNNRWPAREKEIHIIITPPWWRRAWFIILASALLLFLVYKLYRTRIDVVRRTERAKAQVQEL